MSRGGAREGAGRNSRWTCSFEDTKPVRIPKYLKDQVLNIAEKLDKGELLEPDSILIERNENLLEKVQELENRVSKWQAEKSRLCQEVEHLKNQLKETQQLELPLVGNSSNSFEQVKVFVDEVLADKKITRNGKDRGAIRRGLNSLLEKLSLK